MATSEGLNPREISRVKIFVNIQMLVLPLLFLNVRWLSFKLACVLVSYFSLSCQSGAMGLDLAVCRCWCQHHVGGLIIMILVFHFVVI